MAKINRPLSPHLQVYKPQLTSVLSITHRASGIALTVGTLLLVYWLTSLAAGEDSFNGARSFLGSWFGRLLMFGFTLAAFYHLCNGIRHLYWDSGRGFEMDSVYMSGKLVIAAALILSIGTWALAYAWS